MHVESEAPPRYGPHLHSMIDRVKQQAGKTTPTDPRSKRILASRSGGHLLTGLEAHRTRPALPRRRLLPEPLSPDGRTVLTQPDVQDIQCQGLPSREPG